MGGQRGSQWSRTAPAGSQLLKRDVSDLDHVRQRGQMNLVLCSGAEPSTIATCHQCAMLSRACCLFNTVFPVQACLAQSQPLTTCCIMQM